MRRHNSIRDEISRDSCDESCGTKSSRRCVTRGVEDRGDSIHGRSVCLLLRAGNKK